MALPSGYKRLEYIESSGTQYTDTRFTPNQDTRVVMDFQSTLTTGGWAIFGSRVSSSSRTYTFGSTSTNNCWVSGYNTGGVNSGVTENANRHTVDKNKNLCYLDGTLIASSTYAAFTAPGSMRLFTFYAPGETGLSCQIKLYSCKIYDNGTLVRDYIPCETDSGEVGLWDDANGVFYGNAGTGKFIAGPEIGADGFPVNYRRLPYILSDGSAHIDTLYQPTSNTRFVATIDILSSSPANCCVFGIRASGTPTGAFMLWKTGDTLRFDYGSVETAIAVVAVGKHTIDFNKNVFTIDGQSFTASAQTFSSGYNMLLSAGQQANSVDSRKAAAGWWPCQIYENDALQKNYIPCETDTGEVGMWDTVGLQFYGNEGTGAFIAGPEIGSDGFPVSYKRLPSIISDGNAYINTKINPTNNTRAVFKGRFPLDTETAWLFGGRIAHQNATFGILKYQSKFRFDYGKTNTYFASTDTLTTVDANKNTATINGTETVSASEQTFAPGYPMFLFANNNGGTMAYCAKGTSCDSFVVYEDGVLVGDFIPCETDTGEVGMWNVVTLEFHGNAGTGSFINPLAPAGDHNTNIGNVFREVEGMTVNIGGVGREVESGTVLVGGVQMDIEFGGGISVVVVSGTLSEIEGRSSVTLNGTTISTIGTYEQEKPVSISVTVGYSSTMVASNCQITLNGNVVKSGSGTYTFTTEADNVEIEMTQNFSSRGSYDTATITTS